MAWATPQYSRNQVDLAAEFLILDADKGEIASYDDDRALTIVNNWRASHSFPLNTFQIGLRNRSRRIHSESLVSQRIKRLSSIRQKLARFPTMKLAQMQDIGGCRAVMNSVDQVRSLLKDYKQSSLKHELDDIDNYIENPKNSGYRSIHLIYRYHSDRTETFNRLKIEVQIRSRLQHAWATAVETVGTFTRQALKSSEGQEQWLEFFKLMGTALALRERTEPIPNTPTNERILRSEIRSFAHDLRVDSHLEAYGRALHVVEQGHLGKSKYFLLRLRPNGTLTIRGYLGAQLEKAAMDYMEHEREDSQVDAVLVAVDAMTTLRRAFPNYFLDTRVFLRAVRQALKQ